MTHIQKDFKNGQKIIFSDFKSLHKLEIDTNGKHDMAGEVDCNRDIEKKNFPVGIKPCFSYNITGFVRKSDDKFLVVERDANCIWELSFNYRLGETTDFSGLCNHTGGFKDGRGKRALYNKPHSIIKGENGAFYVTDFGNHALRKISSDSKEVSTIVNNTAIMENPRGLTLHKGKVYIAARNYVVVVPTSCSRNCGYRLDVRAAEQPSTRTSNLQETFCVLYDISVMNDNSLVVIDRGSNDELKLIDLSTNTSRPFPLGFSEY